MEWNGMEFSKRGKALVNIDTQNKIDGYWDMVMHSP